MFVHLTKRTKFLVRVCLFSKRTNTNELPAERFTNCSPGSFAALHRMHVAMRVYERECAYITKQGI
ncbi:hypothetical protein Hanom_Chr13g01222641 [Helianthus anomalus]